MTTYKGAGRVTEKPKGIGQDWRAMSHSWGAVTTPKSERTGGSVLRTSYWEAGWRRPFYGSATSDRNKQPACSDPEGREVEKKSPPLLGPSISPLPMLPPGKQSRSQRTSRLTGSQRSASQDPERGGGGTERQMEDVQHKPPDLWREFDPGTAYLQLLCQGASVSQ